MALWLNLLVERSSGFFDFYRVQLIALLDGIHHVLPGTNFAEDSMLPIEPIRDHMGDEKLAAVRIGAGIGHREGTSLVLVWITLGLIFEFVAWSAGSCSRGVAALDHEVGNNAVKNRAVVKSIAGQKNEITNSLRSVLHEEIHDHRAAGRIERGSVLLRGINHHGGRSRVLFTHAPSVGHGPTEGALSWGNDVPVA